MYQSFDNQKSLKQFIILLITFLPLVSLGQAGLNINKSFPSPDVASLGSFGVVPVSPFTGQADISIPIYKLSYKDLELPISLIYGTGGNKIEDHPGWTGLGWTLKSGGIIYRKVNGLYDEHPRQTPISTYTNEIGYLYNCGRVKSDFNNDEAIRKYSFDGTSTAEVIDNAYDAFPDEFVFNFNGYSGTFFFTRPYHNGPLEIKVKSNGDYKLKAEIIEIKDFIEFDDWVDYRSNELVTRRTNRSLYKLKIIDDKGITYVFGGNPNAIEFSNNGNLSQNFFTIANTWHLTEIISPIGHKIQLNYKKAGRVFVQNKQRNTLFFDTSYSFTNRMFIFYRNESGGIQYSGNLSDTFISILNPSYITSITTPIQTIQFNSDKSDQLDYPFDQQKLNELTTPTHKWGATISYWQKLNEINIVGLKRIKFNYLNEQAKRLQLTGISITSELDPGSSKYSFVYNPMSLPAYNSQMADHWGYYNGRSYAYNNDYLNIREPEAAYLQAEMLQKITYPTGGYTQLEYEPHSYKSIAKQFPFVVENQSQNKIAGGLRIKKLINTSSVNELPVIKEFFYQKDYPAGGTNSSGILSGIPQYVNTGSAKNSYENGGFWNKTWGNTTVHFGKIIDNNFLSMSSTNGAHVTYSDVAEKSGDGFIVYNYSNQDNGYHDRAPKKIHTNFDSQWHEEGFTSMEIYRGLLLSTKYLDNNKNTVKEISNEYTIDTLNSFYQIPYFSRVQDNSSGYQLSRVSACLFYTKPALLSKVIEKDFDMITGTVVNNIKEINYYPDKYPSGVAEMDNYKVHEEKLINSIGDRLATTYTYANQLTSGANVYTRMVNANIIGVPIETTNYLEKNGQKMLRSGQLTTYNDANPLNHILPEKSLDLLIGETQSVNFSPYSGSSYDSRYKQIVKYDQYDDKANLIQQTVLENQIKSYQWDKTKTRIVAEVINASANFTGSNGFNEFYFQDFETPGSGSSGSGIAHTGKEYHGLPQYTLNWVKPTLRSYVYSYWYTQAGEWKYSGELPYINNSYNLIGDAFDDIRIYPKDAFMTTYTYDPLVGMTSQTDAKGQTTYYEYDDFQRLKWIKDQQKNIIKAFNYNYGINVDTNPTWTDTGIKECAKINNSFTGEELMQQRDTNPYSSTYNTGRTRSLGMTGNCQSTIYARMHEQNYVNTLRRTTADIMVSFYSDAAGTQPISITNITVLYKEDDENGINIDNYSGIANGTVTKLKAQATIQGNDPFGNPMYYSFFTLRPSLSYIIIP